MIQNVGAGEIAAVVSYLECRPIPAPEAEVLARSGVSLQRQTDMSCADYRALFLNVGQDWLWFSRLRIGESALSDIIHNPQTELHTLHDESDECIGFLELNCTALPAVHISFLGVLPEKTGQGIGTFLMAHAFRLSHVHGADHLKVQTCTLDHPKALAFYRKMGFEVRKQAIEISPDPRLDGTLPRTAAPHVPMVKGELR